MGLFELIVPPGSNVPPRHSHTHNEACVYVLEGTLRYSVDDVTRALRPGDWMRTSKGSVHGFRNPAVGRLALCRRVPGGLEAASDLGVELASGAEPVRAGRLPSAAEFEGLAYHELRRREHRQ
jgi:hypothetical protein